MPARRRTGPRGLPEHAVSAAGTGLKRRHPALHGRLVCDRQHPTAIEKDAHNAVESYRLAADGTIETTFTFRAGGFDGEPKRYTPRGFIKDPASNAIWGMQFVWPVKADYRIAWLAPDYSQTVIGREKRDYVWIMARTPQIPDADYRRILEFLAEQGYDVSRIRRVPQRWEDPA